MPTEYFIKRYMRNRDESSNLPEILRSDLGGSDVDYVFFAATLEQAVQHLEENKYNWHKIELNGVYLHLDRNKLIEKLKETASDCLDYHVIFCSIVDQSSFYVQAIERNYNF